MLATPCTASPRPFSHPKDCSPFPSAHLWLGESAMCVPLLKSTPMLRLESW